MFRRIGANARCYGRSIVHLYLGPIDQDPADDTEAPAAVDRLMDPAKVPLHQRLDLHLLVRGVASMRGEAFCFSAAHDEAAVSSTVAALEESIAAMVAEGTLPF